MTTACTISAQTVEGKTLDVLGNLIAKRQQWMRETTAQAVIATAINILSSLRAVTKVADPKKASGFVSVAQYPGLVVSFRRVGGRNVLCLRPPGRGPNGRPLPHMDGFPFVNAAGQPTRGWNVSVFVAQDRRSADMHNQNGQRYYIIARNLAEAKEFASARRAKRIERYSGMARWTIGQAQSQVAQRTVESLKVAPPAAATGLAALTVSVSESGWSSGNVSVSVSDDLRYAQLALKNGPSDFQLALQKAANRTVGILNHSAERAIFSFEQIPTPFPEVANRKAT